MTDGTDADLQRAYAALRAQRAAQPGGIRPTPEELAGALDGTLPTDQREVVLDHALATGAADDLALLHAARTAAAATNAPLRLESTTTATPPRRRWLRWATPLAAAALVLVVVGIQDRRHDTSPDTGDTVRSIAAGDAAPALLMPAAEATLEDPVTFAWAPAAGAVRYLLEVTDDAGAILLRRESADTAILVRRSDPDAPDLAKASGWWVTAHYQDGTTRRSPLRLLVPAHEP